MVDEIDDVSIEPTADDGESGEGTAEQKLKILRDKFKKADAEANENLAGWQRAKADYINLQKRMRELETGMSQASIVAVIAGFTDVFDSIEASNLPQVLKQLDGALARHGIRRHVPAVGDKFNPQLEEAVSIVATLDESQDNVIHSVLQSGYALDGTTIRPARVTVYHYG